STEWLAVAGSYLLRVLTNTDGRRSRVMGSQKKKTGTAGESNETSNDGAAEQQESRTEQAAGEHASDLRTPECRERQEQDGRATRKMAGRISRLTIANRSAADTASRSREAPSVATSEKPGKSHEANRIDAESTSQTTVKRIRASTAVRMILVIALCSRVGKDE